MRWWGGSMARALGHIRLDAKMDRPEPSMSLDSTTPAFQSVQNIFLQMKEAQTVVAKWKKSPNIHMHSLNVDQFYICCYTILVVLSLNRKTLHNYLQWLLVCIQPQNKGAYQFKKNNSHNMANFKSKNISNYMNMLVKKITESTCWCPASPVQ